MTPNLATPDLLPSAGRMDLGEGPVWDERLLRVYWVDITAGRLHWLNAGSGERKTVQLERTVGFVVMTGDPRRVMVGLGSGLAFVDLSSGRCERIADLEPANALLRCNDGKCDPAGRLWAGTMQWGGDSDPGSLYAVDPDFRVTRRLSGLKIANGLAWCEARAEMYFIDSPARRIDRFHWDAASGMIKAKSPLAAFRPEEGTPDGMTIDRDGHLWVAFWGGACVRQIDGATGQVLAEIKLPVTQVTSCVFGGANLATLFITTAANGLSSAELLQQPLAGGMFMICPGSRGLAGHRFGGPAASQVFHTLTAGAHAAEESFARSDQ